MDRDRILKNIIQFFYIAIFIYSTLGLFLVLYRLFIIVAYPFQVDYGEEFILNEANLLAQGKNYFRDINYSPYLVANHSFIYQLILSLGIKLWGVSFLFGRFVSVCAVIGIGTIIWTIVKLHSKNGHYCFTWCFISVVIFLTSLYVYDWAPNAKVDMTGIFFTLLGILLAEKHKDSGKLFLSVPFFTIAIFTRQSLIAAPFAVALYLFFYNKRIFLKFSLSIILIWASIFFSRII